MRINTKIYADGANVEEIKTIMRSIKHRGPNGDGFSVGTGINFEFHVEKKISYQYMFGI